MEVLLLHTPICDWRIEPHPNGGHVLKRRNHVSPGKVRRWIPVARFGTIEQAIEAVATGRTGEMDWDSARERGRRSDAALPAWTRYEAES
jgi:hypothetical protein